MIVIFMQEIDKISDSSLDQKVVQQESEIAMLNLELQTLRREKIQLIDIHSKCKSQILHSVSIQTDEVCI